MYYQDVIAFNGFYTEETYVSGQQFLDAIDGMGQAVALVGQLETRVEAAETDIGGLTTRVGTVETKASDLETLTGALETEVGSQAAQITSVEGRVTTVEGRITSAENDIVDLDTHLGVQTTRIDGAETEIATINGTIATQGTRIGSLEGNAVVLQGEIDEINAVLVNTFTIDRGTTTPGSGSNTATLVYDGWNRVRYIIQYEGTWSSSVDAYGFYYVLFNGNPATITIPAGKSSRIYGTQSIMFFPSTAYYVLPFGGTWQVSMQCAFTGGGQGNTGNIMIYPNFYARESVGGSTCKFWIYLDLLVQT